MAMDVRCGSDYALLINGRGPFGIQFKGYHFRAVTKQFDIPPESREFIAALESIPMNYEVEEPADPEEEPEE